MSYVESIPSLANAELTVTRRQETPRIDGREQPPTLTTFLIIASVQTPTGKDISRLAEGRNVEDLRVVFTQTALVSGGPGTGFKSDVLTIEGAPFEVEHLEPWSGFGMSYCRAVVRKAYGF